MAALMQSRLVSANTRDGVDTRKQENREIRETICRSDMIIGLGVPTVYWGDFILESDNRKAGRVPSPEPICIVRTDHDEDHIDFLLWRDMAEEPEKYGDDICDWMELNDRLLAGPKRWRIDAYWLNREAERERSWAIDRDHWKSVFAPIAKQASAKCMMRWLDRDIKRFVAKIAKAVTTIQASVRGHQVRSCDPHRDCCMCLSHRMCPLRTAVGYMCRDCGAMGPYEDAMDRDPWNWHRAEYVDETA